MGWIRTAVLVCSLLVGVPAAAVMTGCLIAVAVIRHEYAREPIVKAVPQAHAAISHIASCEDDIAAMQQAPKGTFYSLPDCNNIN